MTNEQVCICCHTVRGCKGCCNNCKNDCNLRHDCEFVTTPQGHDCTWWNAVTSAIREDVILSTLPNNLIKAFKRY